MTMVRKAVHSGASAGNLLATVIVCSVLSAEDEGPAEWSVPVTLTMWG